MKKPTTIKDIARQLSISPSTVSRALKDNPEISVDTKKRVWQLAKELDYEPNTIALNLRQQKTDTIGVILPEIVHFFFSTVISGIEEVAYAKGYNVIVSQSNEQVEREIADVRTLFNHRVDGILACISKETTNYDHFHAIQDKGTPLVFFDRVAPGVDASKVIVDDEDGGYKATKHLIEKGKTRILHLAGPENLSISSSRIDGFVKAHKEAGLKFESSQIINCDTGKEIEAHQIVDKLIEDDFPFDGIFAVNDMAALGAMNAVKEAGMKIPDDVAIVGFSNWQICAYIEPPMTTISQPGYLIGQKATELLIREIEMKENEFIEPTSIQLPVELVIRQST